MCGYFRVRTNQKLQRRLITFNCLIQILFHRDGIVTYLLKTLLIAQLEIGKSKARFDIFIDREIRTRADLILAIFILSTYYSASLYFPARQVASTTQLAVNTNTKIDID